jgi:hypothetical protein
MGSPGRAIEKVKALFLDKINQADPALAARLREDAQIKSL